MDRARVSDAADRALLESNATPWPGVAAAAKPDLYEAVAARAELFDREPVQRPKPKTLTFELTPTAAAAHLVGAVVDFFVCVRADFFVGYPLLSTFDVAAIDARASRIGGDACTFSYDARRFEAARWGTSYSTGGGAALEAAGRGEL